MKKKITGLVNYVLLTSLAFGTFLLIGFACSGNDKKQVKQPIRNGMNDKVIVKQATDERGLTSVVFYYSFWPSDTFAFDYLSSAEYQRQFSPPCFIKTKYVCPDCGEWGCIYEDIGELSGEGSDSEIEAAIQSVCRDRGITDEKTIDLLRANYYL